MEGGWERGQISRRGGALLTPANSCLAKVNYHVHVRYNVVVRPSVVWLSVCLSSVTFVHPTQAIEIFGDTPFGTLPFVDFQVKFYGDRPRGTPPSGS